MDRLPDPHEDRFLVVDDTDEDVSQILTIICDGRPRAARSDNSDLLGGGQ